MIKRFWLALAITSAVVAFLIAAKLQSASNDTYELSRGNEDKMLKHLRPALRSAGNAARLYYHIDCHTTGGDPLPFPLTKTQPPQQDERGVPAVQAIFRNDTNVTVEQEPSGLVAIRIGKVSAQILETKLASLNFEPMDQYNPTEAIGVIEGTKEFQDAARSLGIKPVWSYSAPLVQPRTELPHLPASLKDATVQEVLDLIAKTFNGIVIYGECSGGTGPRAAWIDFAPIETLNGIEKK